MSELATLYGCIEGAFGSTKSWNDLYAKNQEAIGSLPMQDEWPPLNSGIFLAPMPFYQGEHRLDFYRIQMIHFGASFNHFVNGWPIWLDKFEKLLAKMFWHRVHLHLEIELFGKYEYLWETSMEEIHRFYESPPVPVAKWSFSGGPRHFAT